MIYKFRRPSEEEIVTEFFLPDKSVLDTLARNMTLAKYNADGYICAGFVRVDKETYLNARLNQTVQEYCENEEYRRNMTERYHNHTVTSEVFFETMRLVDDWKWACLKKLNMQVRRLIREDFNIWNEIALQLYDGVHGHNSVTV